MLLSQVLTLPSTAQHCRQSCDLCSHTLSLLPSFQSWEGWGPHMDTASGGAGQRENIQDVSSIHITKGPTELCLQDASGSLWEYLCFLLFLKLSAAFSPLCFTSRFTYASPMW